VSRLQEFLDWVGATDPKFIIVRFVDDAVVEWASAETEVEAMTKRLELKSRGGLVDVFKGAQRPVLDPKMMN